MAGYGIATCSFFIVLMVTACQATGAPPNIVFILVDDLGWADVGFHNPAMLTPNIDRLAREGIILNQNYVQPLCSPSRAALMTGIYPYRMGLQHVVIYYDQPVCAPLSKTFLPEVLKQRGYATHMLGKWHLGFCDWRCTPTFRGFDTFYGYYTSEEDYYTKVHAGGYDFRDNEIVDKSANGTYSTYLYSARIKQIIESHDVSQPLFLYLSYQSVHDPLKAPQKYTDLYFDIHNEKRRVHSGIMSALDESVGEVVESLKRKGLYNNTLLVFSADNGGSVDLGSSNYPLRGAKFSLFEGGTRAASFVHGPMFNNTGGQYDGLMHIVDWFPTLAEAAGAEYDAHDQDGVSQWQSLLSLTPLSTRDEILYNLDLSDDPVQGRAAIRVGDYKLLAGFPGLYREWYPPPETTGGPATADRTQAQASFDWIRQHHVTINATDKNGFFQEPIDFNSSLYCYLFNVKDDPEERHNLYDSHPHIVHQLQERLAAHLTRYVPPNFPRPDPRSSPARWGGVWTPGWCPDIAP